MISPGHFKKTGEDMKKETYYFQHDYEPTSDPKMQAFVGEHGGLGYGVYWRVVEMLHSDIEHKIQLKDYVFMALAKQMMASVEQIVAIIQFAITPCELFVSDGEFVWSNRVNDNFTKRHEVSEMRAKAGRLGGYAKSSLASAKQILAKSGKGKERKEKESKVKEISNTGTDVPRTLFKPPEQKEVEEYITAKGWNVSADRFVAFYESKGWMIGKNKMKDWKAAVKTWQYSNNPKSSGDDEPWIIKKK